MIHITVSPAHEDVRPIVEDIARNGIPDDVIFIHRGRNTIAYIPDPPLNIKAYRPPSGLKSLIYGIMRAPKARRAYLFAQRLISLGFNTPEPIAFVEEHQGPRLVRSYFISRQLFGWREIRNIEFDPIFDDLAEPLARFVADLHAKGVNMKDMTPGNILFKKNDEGRWDFCLVDINRMAFENIDKATVLSNFAGVLNTRHAVVRVARAYAEVRGWDADAFADEVSKAVLDRRAARLRKRALKRRFLPKPKPRQIIR